MTNSDCRKRHDFSSKFTVERLEDRCLLSRSLQVVDPNDADVFQIRLDGPGTFTVTDTDEDGITEIRFRKTNQSSVFNIGLLREGHDGDGVLQIERVRFGRSAVAPSLSSADTIDFLQEAHAARFWPELLDRDQEQPPTAILSAVSDPRKLVGISMNPPSPYCTGEEVQVKAVVEPAGANATYKWERRMLPEGEWQPLPHQTQSFTLRIEEQTGDFELGVTVTFAAMAQVLPPKTASGTERYTVTTSQAVGLRNFGNLSPLAEYGQRNIVKADYWNGNEQLGLVPISGGAKDFPDGAAVNAAEIVGTVCGGGGMLWKWERTVSRRAWHVRWDDDAKTQAVAEKLGWETENNEDNSPVDVVDTSPSATNRIYDSDNPRINLGSMLIRGGAAAVGEVIIVKWTFMQKLFRGADAEPVVRYEWHSTITVRRKALTGTVAQQWERVSTNEIGPGPQNIVLTQAEAQAAMGTGVTVSLAADANTPPIQPPS